MSEHHTFLWQEQNCFEGGSETFASFKPKGCY